MCADRRVTRHVRAREVGALLAILAALMPPPAGARTASLAELSLEELSNIEITSVSKRGESLAEAPASVYVITGAQIRRSGATTLPEALRLAPNLHVARIYASGYAVSARGFNSQSANKLLVLVDGRSVYTPFFAGVFWDVQDLMLEDIDRIEVISGPGGTLWGVNAVNGIINVITREAAQTQGSLVSAGAGTDDATLSLRHGAALGEHAHFRIQARHLERRHTENEAGLRLRDAQHLAQLGGRLDWQDGQDRVSLIGNAYDGKRQQPPPGSIRLSGVTFALGDIPTSGANLLARWDRQLADGSSWMLQAYYDRTRRNVVPTFAETLDIADLQLQHGWPLSERQRLVWGAEYRAGRDHMTNSAYIAFLPARLEQTWSSLFAQDELSLTPELKLTVGARLERNSYTGNEWLPSARLAWKVAPEQLLWTSASRSVRAPSRLDVDIFVPGNGPPFRLAGGADVRSEIAKVVELGYRGRPSESTNLSVTAFRADYDDLRTQEVDFVRRLALFASKMEGVVHGLELWGTWQLRPGWRLQAGFSRLWQDFRLKPGSNDTTSVRNAEGATPARQGLLQLAWDISPTSELDASLRHVSRLLSPDVPPYTALDLRWGWRPLPQAEVSLALRNVNGGGHGEFSPVETRSELQRQVQLKLVLSF